MTAPGVGSDVERATVERAFVAVRYALGQRPPQVLRRLLAASPEAKRLAQALSHDDRRERARALAADLRPIVEALDRMRLACR